MRSHSRTWLGPNPFGGLAHSTPLLPLGRNLIRTVGAFHALTPDGIFFNCDSSLAQRQQLRQV